MQQLLRFLVLHATLQVHLAPLQAGLLLSVWGAKLGVLAEKNFQSARSLMPKAAVETSIERNGASSASFQLDGVPQSGDDAQAASSVDDLLSTYITSSSDVDTSSSSTIGQISIAMDVMPLEGCSASANIEWIFSKNNKPASGNIASNAIDGKASTRWAAWGRSKWLKAGFSGGEDGDYLVEGVAIAFHNGDRRVAFFDITLLNEADKIVSTRKGLESSGLTDQFQVFELEKPVGGSTIILTLRGTTANAWNSISEISVCLAPIKTPSPVPVPTSPSMESPSGITFVGCFLDDTSGSTRTIDSAHTSMEDLTPLKCARFCAGYKFMGLQYSQECFCGDTYYTEEAPAVATDTCFMPCIGDVETTCGGPWANSVYVVGDPTVANGEVTGIDDGESGQIPRRQFTVVNQCEQMIRVGSTGGFVQAMTDEDGTCPSGSILDSTVKSCFWALPLPEEGKSYDLESGGQLRLVFDHEAINGVRWSGNMWASTGCDKSVGCETATCLRNTGWPDGYCPPSTGPTGPVTKAEFTLVDTGVDYYDVTVIDGVNLPLEMRPDPESNPLERDDDYWCSNPGGPNPMAKGLESCTWDFDPSIEGLGDMSNYLRWVRNDAGFVDCETDSDCVNLEGSEFGVTYKCGALFGQDALNGAQTTEVFPKKCGSTLGWHSAGGICGASEAKPLGYFPNSYPFMCNVRTEQVAKDNSTQADLYSCRGTYYSQSGYSRGAEETACGCPEWLDVGINAPSSSPCESHNPYWNTLSLPWLKYLKKGCPTSYSFPFDDHTSTFVCRNEDLRNTHSGFNSMSYILTFCPASCILTSRR